MSQITCYDSDGNALKRLFQWDSGRVITVRGVDTANRITCHFSNRLSKDALIVTPTMISGGFTVNVPNILLQQAEPLNLYIYETAADEHMTTHVVNIPVVPRTMPSGYEYDEGVDYMDVEGLTNEVNTLRASVENDQAAIYTATNNAETAAAAANNAATLASSTAVAFGPYNAFDILAGCSKPTRTVNGITFSWSGNKLIVDGTFPSVGTDQSASSSAFNSTNSFPFGMKPGMTIRLASDISPVWVYIGFYKDGNWSSNQFMGSAARQIQIPSDVTGVRLGVGVSTTYEQSPGYGHAEVEVAILSSDVMTNAELKSADDELKNTIQRTFPAHGASEGGTRFSSDLNNLDEEGTYILEGSGTFVNGPYDSPRAGAMLLIVYPVIRTYGYQPTATMHQVLIYVRDNAIWVRSRSSGVWNSWGRCSLPVGPSSDGTYALKCTVSNNALTYTWVRD